MSAFSLYSKFRTKWSTLKSFRHFSQSTNLARLALAFQTAFRPYIFFERSTLNFRALRKRSCSGQSLRRHAPAVSYHGEGIKSLLVPELLQLGPKLVHLRILLRRCMSRVSALSIWTCRGVVIVVVFGVELHLGSGHGRKTLDRYS